MRLPWMRRRPTAGALDQHAEDPGAQAGGPSSQQPEPAPSSDPGGTAPQVAEDAIGPGRDAGAVSGQTPVPSPRTPAAAMAAASAAVYSQQPFPDAADSPPVVMMPHAGQPQRRGLIPRWVPWAAGGTAGAIVLIVIVAVLLSRSSVVRVPSVAGLDRKAAETRLQELGLKLTVGDRRFSASAAVGSIIDQQPKAGTQVDEGSVVTVALSGGSEIFPMPDVLGKSLDAARLALRDRGLTVEFQTAPSDKEQGTVISSIPSPGQQIQTGDTVRLTIAAGTSGSEVLLPSDLKGLTFVVDPAPMPAGSGADTTLDVARRIRALLEASGARVVVTRSVTDAGDAANTLARAKRARESSSTALVGLSVTQSGVSGLAVASMPNTSTTQALYLRSFALSQAITAALKTPFPSVLTATTNNDTILTDTGVPALRIRLGSSQSSADRLSFTDPQWADSVAKAVYRGIGQVFGAK